MPAKKPTKIKRKATKFDLQIKSELEYYIRQETKKIYPPMIHHVSREGELHPSAFPFCGLWDAYNTITKKPKKPLDFNGEFYTQIGTVVHALIQRHLGRGGKILGDWKCLDCGKQKKLAYYTKCKKCGSDNLEYEELGIKWGKYTHGHVDCVIDINGKLFVLDYKTSSVKNNNEHRTKGKFPYKHNLAQVKSYIVYLEECFNIKISGWILVYISRDHNFNDTEIVGDFISEEEKKELKKKLKLHDKLFGELMKFNKTKDIKYLQRLIKYKPCKTKQDYKDEYYDYFDPCPLGESGTCFNSDKLENTFKDIIAGKKKVYHV